MTNYTRTTHTVRIKSQDSRFYADVEILDAISLKLPNGFDICYKITPTDVVSPRIIDNTGDGNGKPGGGLSSRVSHMVRVTSTTNPQMFFDVEVCDAFTLTGPNNAEFCIQCATPDPDSIPAIVDNTDSGLAVAASAQSTRAQHVAKLLHQVGTGAAGQLNQQVTTDYTLTLLTDALVFQGPLQSMGMPWQVETDFGGPADVASFLDFQSGPWYDEHALQFFNYDTVANGALSPGANTNDITVYVTDPATGEQVPPPNTDPNVYVYFPPSASGPFLGASPYAASGIPVAGTVSIPAIDMGPIWWLRALGATDNVWFWAVSPVQTPLAFGYFAGGGGGLGTSWGYRGFELLPYFPVIWILSENYPLVSMGTIGAPNIETAAAGYTVIGGDGSTTLSWFGVGYPDGGWGVSTAVTTNGGYLGAGLPFLTYTFTNYYMPFGAFDLTGPTSAELLAVAQQAGDASKYTNFGGPPPNIWELTGIAQPPLQHPGDLWNASANPHQQPSLALAQQVVQAFEDNWNAVVSAVNAALASFTGGQWPPWSTPNPPGWDWEVPYGGNTVPTAQEFSNGWVPAVIPEDTVPATLQYITTGQLDPAVWNVEPVITNGNPPVLWSTGAP